MPAVVADPQRWCGEGLATLSALSYYNRREEDIQRLLKSPQLFPGFYCTSENLQGRRQKKKKKRLSEKKVPLLTRKLPLRAYCY